MILNSLEKAREMYPELPELDIHYYGMKGYGIKDGDIKKGIPRFHLIDQEKLFNVAALVSSEHSPYEFNQSKLTYKGNALPFKVKHLGRVLPDHDYFYLRGIQEWTPTLYSESILNANPRPFCKGCKWCLRILEKKMKSLSPREWVQKILKVGINFQEVNKITFNTGRYRDGEAVVDNLLGIVNLSKEQGFNGRVLYIGSQIQDPSLVKRLIEGLDRTPFKYAYTLETFTKRERMHKLKGEPLEVVLKRMEDIKDAGVENIEYTNILGLDSLDAVYKWIPHFSKLALPHLSIFRLADNSQEYLKSQDFIKDPVGYLCSIRYAFEEQHGRPIYSNNLASLWGFPISKINPLFLTEKTSLGGYPIQIHFGNIKENIS